MPHFSDYQDTDLSFLTSSTPLQNQQTPYIVLQQNYSSPTTPLQNQQIPYIVPQQNYSSPAITTPNDLVPLVIRKSTRSTKPLAYLKDFHCNVAVGMENKNFSLVKYLISSFVNYSKFSNNHKHFAFSISSIVEPKTYAQAVKRENLRKAMYDEFKLEPGSLLTFQLENKQ